MTLDEYQVAARRTADLKLRHVDRVSNACMGLCGETGEVVDYLKKHLYHGHRMALDDLAEELGDVLWYVAEIASAHRLMLGDIAQRNVDKLKRRYPDGFSHNDSINRKD